MYDEENLGEKVLSKALNINEFEDLLNSLMNKYGIKIEENATYVTITCPDDQSSSVIHHLISNGKYAGLKSKHYLVYNRSAFGGIFVPEHKTYESLVPASHHIPNNSNNLVVLNFSHIGYDEKNKVWGRFVRYGHSDASSSCGAIVSLYNAIKMDEDIGIKDKDLRSLANFLREVIEEYNITEDENGEHILNLTVKALEEQSDWVLEQLKYLSQEEKVNILYVSGLEIDMNKEGREYNDKIFISGVYYINNKGEITHEPLDYKLEHKISEYL